MLKPPKSVYLKNFSGFSTFRISLFHTKVQSKTHAVSDAAFWTSFFEILVRLDAKKIDFGSPVAPSWAQNASQNRPSGTKSPPKKHKMVLPRTFLEAISFQKLILAPKRLILAPFRHQNRIQISKNGVPEPLVFRLRFYIDF